jgi:rhodanese-related sulfurtransferase
MKYLLVLIFFGAMVCAQNLSELQSAGVTVTDDRGIVHSVKRIIPAGCRVPITNSVIWEGEFSDPEVPQRCKITLVKTAGKISPMTIAPGVETYGELEVLRFMKTMKDPKKHYLLVDSRGNEWYRYDTIPGAINLWFLPMKEPQQFPKRFKAIYDRLGVKKGRDGTYDYSEAATILLFCNGAWCGQSPAAVRSLLQLGYPPEKIKWYRGGMHAWKSLSMTTTRGEDE